MPAALNTQVSFPFGHLDVACEERAAITLNDAAVIFPAAADSFRRSANPIETAYEICDTLREGCELQGSHEHLFLLLYFNHIVERIKSGLSFREALLPLPKARISVTGKSKPVTVDFAFWTGQRLVAVFIDEGGFRRHSHVEEGCLKVFGFEVFCLMADEFEIRGLTGATGQKILEALSLR